MTANLAPIDGDDRPYRILVEAIKDYAIYMLDPDGRVVNWNAGARRFKGYSADEIIGEHFSRFYSEEDRRTGLPQRALRIARTEGKFEAEGWRVRKDGTRFWASVVIDPIHDDEGMLIGFAKITRDLTERRQVQQELEIAREALFQSQKMEAIGQLTGGVAHDFNNLLMATLSSLELLRKHIGDNPQALKLLDNAVQGAERGATLTQRMLAFARRQDLKPVRVELPNLVRGIGDLIRRSLGPSIAIDTRFPLDLAAVTADANQLEMALLNLIVNARDAMPDGGEIIIAARNRQVGADGPAGLAPGDYIALSVIDSGSGMDEATLTKAMEPFFTTKGVGKGTGLGLAMVHGLAEQLDGRFILESELGKGTVATLWLPAAGAQEEAATVAAAPETVAETRPLRVLAVDDDALVLMNTVALLEDLGHTVFEAMSGAEALDIFRREPDLDLVITDQAMPHMTGVQFATAALAERPGVPFILATGYGEVPAGAEIAFVKLGKPFRQKDLVQSVTLAMEQVTAT
jgi:PAS domain S-box-containing protein